jgi:uncharacterized coiled-coil protein SlyX
VKKLIPIKTLEEAKAFQKFQVKEQARHWHDIEKIQSDLFKLYRKFPELDPLYWPQADPDEFYVVEEDDDSV